MDMNDARVVLTLLAFIGFIAIVAWAYSSRRKGFEEAAELPFADEPDAKRSENGEGQMSDFGASQFFSVFWDYYIAMISIVSMVGCARAPVVPGPPHDQAKLNAGRNRNHRATCGTVTFSEYHNPMPRWWIWLFYITVVFSIVYLSFFRASARSGRAC